jgi:hypothetical protein
MKGWLDKYNDGGPVQENYNDYSVSAPDGYVGVGTFNEGRDYSPAWGGQFQDGGKLSFISNPKLRNMLEGYQPGFLETVGDYRLPEGQIIPLRDPSTEVSMSIGGEGGEPSYLIPSFKYGQPLQDPVQEFDMTGQYLGGPFKTWQDAEKFGKLRHQYVEKGQPLPSPIATANMAMGGSLPGATGHFYARYEHGGLVPGDVGFDYPRTIDPAPDNGPGAKKTMASAQKGGKYPKVLTEEERYEKELKDREAAEAAAHEASFKQLEKEIAAKDAADSAKRQAEQNEEFRKRAEIYKEKENWINNPKTYDDVNTYVSLMLEMNENKINQSDVSATKKNIINYINSPIYAKRQANFPEQYIAGEAERYQKNKYESTIAKNKREERIRNLNMTPVIIDKKKNLYDLNHFDTKSGKILLSEKNMPEVVAHELSHAALFEKDNPKLIDSDYMNTKYWDSVVSKSKKLPTDLGLNRSEMDKFLELAREVDESGARDVHADKNANTVKFSGEQYGDLMGVRNLLYKSGITKSFGEELDKTKMDKALNNKKIKDNPIFKRFLYIYGPENVIQLNNTIAANNSQEGMPMAQNGMEMSYYQNGLDFKPKGMGKNGKVIKDDRGQWAHPGEITQIGSNQITMQGVPYPVLGISDTGDTQMMYPNEEYEYDGESVTEYPMMKQGGQLTKLDQLLNFTNYNTKQPGGWLDKYQ